MTTICVLTFRSGGEGRGRGHLEDRIMRAKVMVWGTMTLFMAAGLTALLLPRPTANARAEDKPARSDAPVVEPDSLAAVIKRMEADKPKVMERQSKLLHERYDLSDRPVKGVTMSRSKAIQAGVRVKLPADVSWNALATMTPEAIRKKGLWPKGFLPLPHPNHPEGGMVFPKFHIDEIKRQEDRDLDALRPRLRSSRSSPARVSASPMYLTTRLDLQDVTKGKLVTLANYYEMFKGILNPKQLEGLRLLLTPFPQQQFNQTDDRRTVKFSRGVACFDCHVNGHTNAATHLVGDIRPQEFRHRIDVPSLRGVNVQRLFGSQRALKTVEDFTEFEQRLAYFDADSMLAAKKGVNILERGSQVHAMAEFEELLDFPPAPKLDLFGHLDPAKANEAELRGEKLFFAKAKCAVCHPAPFYTDNLMHNLQTERFFAPVLVNGRMAAIDGPIKTFPLRGIKDSPPYLHDDRLLTLDDTVEFFNLVLSLQLTDTEEGRFAGVYALSVIRQ